VWASSGTGAEANRRGERAPCACSGAGRDVKDRRLCLNATLEYVRCSRPRRIQCAVVGDGRWQPVARAASREGVHAAWDSRAGAAAGGGHAPARARTGARATGKLFLRYTYVSRETCARHAPTRPHRAQRSRESDLSEKTLETLKLGAGGNRIQERTHRTTQRKPKHLQRDPPQAPLLGIHGSRCGLS
jgi:hypothetical protein